MAGSTRASCSVEAGRGRGLWPRFRRHRLALLGLVQLALTLLLVMLGPWWWATPVDAIDFSARLAGPSLVHPLGTDDLGQDILARLLRGGRISLAVGLAAMAIALLIGVTVGLCAGLSRGWPGRALMWLTDLFLSLPPLPVLLLLMHFFREPLRLAIGPEAGIFVLVVLAIGGFRWMTVARLVRAQVLTLRELPFVTAARALGASRLQQVRRHILPNALGPVIVAGSTDVAAALIAESTLSFLGLGFPPDVPSWGRMLYDARDYLDIAPHWALAPGLAVALTVLAINFVGDGLRDASDPRRGD